MWTAPRQPLRPIPVIPKLMWRIHIDTIDFQHYESDSGNAFVLIGVCALSKFCEAEGTFKKYF